MLGTTKIVPTFGAVPKPCRVCKVGTWHRDGSESKPLCQQHGGRPLSEGTVDATMPFAKKRRK